MISADQKRPFVNYRVRVASKSHDKRKATANNSIFLVTISNLTWETNVIIQEQIMNIIDQDHVKELNFLKSQGELQVKLTSAESAVKLYEQYKNVEVKGVLV